MTATRISKADAAATAIDGMQPCIHSARESLASLKVALYDSNGSSALSCSMAMVLNDTSTIILTALTLYVLDILLLRMLTNETTSYRSSAICFPLRY